MQGCLVILKFRVLFSFSKITLFCSLCSRRSAITHGCLIWWSKYPRYGLVCLKWFVLIDMLMICDRFVWTYSLMAVSRMLNSCKCWCVAHLLMFVTDLFHQSKLGNVHTYLPSFSLFLAKIYVLHCFLVYCLQFWCCSMCIDMLHTEMILLFVQAHGVVR